MSPSCWVSSQQGPQPAAPTDGDEAHHFERHSNHRLLLRRGAMERVQGVCWPGVLSHGQDPGPQASSLSAECRPLLPQALGLTFSHRRPPCNRHPSVATVAGPGKFWEWGGSWPPAGLPSSVLTSPKVEARLWGAPIREGVPDDRTVY